MKFSHSDRWKIGLGAAAILGLGAVLAPSLREALSIAPLMRHVRGAWLFAALLCQAMMYVCVAQILASALSTLKTGISLPKLYLPAVIFLFANRVVPGPAIAGLACIVYLLGKHKVSATDAQVAAGSFYLADYASFFIMIVFVAISLIAGRGSVVESKGPYFLATGIIVLLLALVGVAYAQAERVISWGIKIIGRVERVFRPNSNSMVLAETVNRLLTALHHQSQSLIKNPAALAAIVGTGVIMHMCEAFTLVCAAHGFGARLSFGAAAGSYVAGNLAAIVSFLPGGVGLYDGAMISVLHTAGHLPLPTAGATTIVYRLLSLALPFPFAVTAIRQALERQAPANVEVGTM